MTNQYHATPYDISATGFYFSTYEEYCEKAASHTNKYGQPVEEYEIQYINGDNHELFLALGINQANLQLWFEEFEDLCEEDIIKAIYLANNFGYSAEEITDRLEDVCLFEGTAEQYAEDFIEETGALNHETLRYYFDTKAFARDMLLGGDISEITVNGTEYIVWGD
ncbi:MAG: hypothetical protein CMK70_03020 [Pseudohongiella sp.]|nr:hypothetical protein [Pseudohongiella sp.]